MEVLPIFILFAFLALVIRLCAGAMDGDRVGQYIRSQGGEVLESHWSPFGRGWFGEKNDRIYEVRYRDRAGDTHHATVKTSMFSGVYLTDDRIVQRATTEQPNREESLEWENARLRQRVAELERESER